MKSIYLILSTFFLLMCFDLSARKTDSVDIKVVNYYAQKSGNLLSVGFTLDCSDLKLASNEMLKVQPALVGATGRDSLKMSYLLFTGKRREMINQRRLKLYGEDNVEVWEDNTAMFRKIEINNVDESNISYRLEVPFQDWMYGSQLVLLMDVYGCADCHNSLAAKPLSRVPNEPRVSYMRPPAQQVEDIVVPLYLNFPLDRSILLEDFADNKMELGKIHEAVNAVQELKNVQMIGVQVEGYASPEGRYAYNERLSANRAQTVHDYLMNTDHVADRLMDVNARSEDWDGLVHSLDMFDIAHADEIKRIVNEVSDPDARDHQIRAIDNGQTYNYILRNVYPKLRRVDVKITLETSQPSSIEEIRDMVVNYPDQLSINDFYWAANQYQPHTPEYDEIFFFATQMYPEDKVSSMNQAAAALKKNDLAKARKALKNAPDTPETWNNMGVLYMKEGKNAEAVKYFQKAQRAGNKDAEYNLQNMININR